jgi:hypothetical protein
MSKLTLSERIDLAEARSLETAQERIARADAVYHPSPEELARILKNCEDMRARYEFRQDVKTAVWLAGILVAFLGAWWIFHVMKGGSW